VGFKFNTVNTVAAAGLPPVINDVLLDYDIDVKMTCCQPADDAGQYAPVVQHINIQNIGWCRLSFDASSNMPAGDCAIPMVLRSSLIVRRQRPRPNPSASQFVQRPCTRARLSSLPASRATLGGLDGD